MTIALSANTPRVSYTVSQGVTQTSFAVPFVFFTGSTDLNVFVDNVARTFDASTANTSLFTVSGGSGSTGTVTTTVTGATGGSTVVITRAVPLSRTTDFPSSGAFEVSKLNTELDTIVTLIADADDENSRALRLKDSDAAVDLTLPLKADRLGTVLGFNATTGAAEAGPTIANVNSLADITTNINTVAGISANVTTVAGISSNVTTVAGIASNVTTLAASDVVADMALLADSAVIADMALLATTDVIADMALLADTDVIADMNTLATSDIVSDLNTLATSDIVTDLNILATADNVTNMATLGASGVVGNIATVAGVASNVTTVAGVASNVTTVAGISSNVTTVAGISSNVTTVAGDTTNIGTIATDLSGTDTIGTVAGSISNVNSVAGAITNVNTVASNISGVNSFAERYRVASSDPSSNNDAGDLVYNTTDNNLKFFNGSSFVAVGGAISNLVEDTTPQLGGNLDVNGNDIVSTSNADIDIVPNGTGNVTLQTDTVQLGSSNEDVTITTNGTGDLTLNTNSGTDSGSIVIADGANQNVTITPNGTGKVVLDGLSYPTADGSAGQFLKTDGSGALSFDTVSGTTINNNANNRVITGSGTANTLEGEANFTFDGSKVAIGSGLSPSAALHVSGTNNNVASQFYLTAEGNQTFKLGGSGASTFFSSDHSAPTFDFRRAATGTAVGGTQMFFIDNNNIQIRTDNQGTTLNGTRGISKCWHTGNGNSQIDAHNVSSYQDHGTGQQTVHISHNYANANYCISFGSKFSGTFAWLTLQNNPAAGSYRFTMGDRNGGVQEGSRMMSMTMGQSG